MPDSLGKERVSRFTKIFRCSKNLTADVVFEQRLCRHPEHSVGEFVAHQFAEVVHFICGADDSDNTEFAESPVLLTSVGIEVLVVFGEFSHDARLAIPVIPERGSLDLQEIVSGVLPLRQVWFFYGKSGIGVDGLRVIHFRAVPVKDEAALLRPLIETDVELGDLDLVARDDLGFLAERRGWIFELPGSFVGQEIGVYRCPAVAHVVEELEPADIAAFLETGQNILHVAPDIVRFIAADREKVIHAGDVERVEQLHHRAALARPPKRAFRGSRLRRCLVWHPPHYEEVARNWKRSCPQGVS